MSSELLRSRYVVILTLANIIHRSDSFRATDCYDPCEGGNCRYDDCQEEPATCSGGLCSFYNCVRPTCDGGACSFERCWMPSCRGGGCSISNPMLVEPNGDPDQDLFSPPDLSAYTPNLRGSNDQGSSIGSSSSISSFSGSSSSRSSDFSSLSGDSSVSTVRIPPPPPPAQVAAQQLILDPREAQRVANEASMEVDMLASLREKKANGVLAGAESVQLEYLEARAASEAKRMEWESHQAEVHRAYEAAKRAQQEMEAQRRAAQVEAARVAAEKAAEEARRKQLEEEEAARVAAALAEQLRQAAEAQALARARFYAQAEALEDQRRAEEEAEALRKANAQAAFQDRIVSRQEAKLLEQHHDLLRSWDPKSGAAIAAAAGSSSPRTAAIAAPANPSATLLQQSGGAPKDPQAHSFAAGTVTTARALPGSFGAPAAHEETSGKGSSGDGVTASSPAAGSGTGAASSSSTLLEQVNRNGACKLPMASFEVAVLALAVFLSPDGLSLDLTDFLKLTNRVGGIFCALVAAVSVATPGGELAMLCCVDPYNDLLLRTWAAMALLTLSVKAIFEARPDRHERWLRLLQVACVLFVADCFILQQRVCYSTSYGSDGAAQRFQSTAMYLWAAAIFYLVYKVELYIEDDDGDFDSRHSSKHSSSTRRRKQRRSGGQSDFSDSLGLPCLPSSELIDKSLDRRVDICEVDSDDDNSTKSK